MHTINLSILRFINSGAGYYTALDTSMLFLTMYLTYGVVIGVLVYMGVVVPLQRQGLDRLRALGQGVECVIALGTTWLMVQAIKVFVAYPRPFHIVPEINALIPGQSGYSFPSGHTAMIFAVATITYYYHRRLGQLLFAFALVVGMSRIYTGVHYPVDVLVGAGIGIGVPVVLHVLISYIGKSRVQ